MSYRAPVDDILFDLAHVAPGPHSAPSADSLEEWRTVLEEAAALTEEVIAPLNHAGDREGSVFENGVVRTPAGWRQAYRTWAEAGWNGVALPPEHGGAGLPTVVGTATMEMLTSACASFSTLPVLMQGAVHALDVHADDAIKQTYLPNIVSGIWAATMNLTEPQAGSDLGLLTTRAEPAGDGSYRIFGQKIFITFGEHDLTENIIHLVLARLPGAPAGTKGISLFVVPKFFVGAGGKLGARNDVRCASIEHKLGIRASPTCTMIYGDHDGAVGWLVGKPHQGLACMFTMMNRARLATGLQGVAIAERATQQALAYAMERRQGRADGHQGPAPITAHPDVRRMLGRMKAVTAAVRAIQYFIAAAIDDAHLAVGDEAKKRGQAYADLLTPIFKAFGTECGVEVASLGIQVHGGMGYVEETGAAQHWRDARIAPIYEGTNGIQAIDLVTRKVMRDGGESMRLLIEECRAMLSAGELPSAAQAELAPVAQAVAAGLDHLQFATAWVLDRERDPEQLLYAASSYLRLAGIALGAALLVKGAAAASRLAIEGAAMRRAYAAIFADELAVEIPALWRKLANPTTTRRAWGAVVGEGA